MAHATLERSEMMARGTYVSGQKDLSPRETEVIWLIIEGLTNKEIAGRIGVSPNTVKFHAYNVMGKLKVRSRVSAAVAYALAHVSQAQERLASASSASPGEAARPREQLTLPMVRSSGERHVSPLPTSKHALLPSR